MMDCKEPRKKQLVVSETHNGLSSLSHITRYVNMEDVG